MPMLRFALLLMSFALLAGCAMPMPRDDTAWAATAPLEPPVAAAQADGAIYHEAQSMELFADPRAHRVGDILTISLVESTQASKKSATSTSKKDKTNITAPTLLGRALTLDGRNADISTQSGNNFDGNGSSSQSNQLTGQITVTVAQRLSNGNLLVRGEKWLTINQGQELVRVSGIVRPQDIGQDNIVPSTRVADARIGYTGRGTLADANTRGWLSRFFNSKWMPY
ncbi:flagellar basal body L-ring protein FlgH [Dyella tabacisoli]|uniref:Flagellar L-ring protein n=1 Tax=Dyella tabacisoli TaxID=2282381 RepID=A0A369UPF3_9GAMM|nr:flagellar basal body L-ring protein FlgH [Dyella tabacisoli]RDD82642.1 flagellar basal body L-ring protein FlgH [Dyella tabacisoli]